MKTTTKIPSEDRFGRFTAARRARSILLRRAAGLWGRGEYPTMTEAFAALAKRYGVRT